MLILLNQAEKHSALNAFTASKIKAVKMKAAIIIIMVK